MKQKLVNKELIAIIALIVFFILRAAYLACTVAPGMAPDEMFHIQVVDLHARSSALFPFFGSSNPLANPLPEFSRFGRAAEYPYLYHLLCGKIVALLGLETFDFSTIVFLRLLNVVVSAVNLLLVFRIGRRLLDGAARYLFYVVSSSLLQQTILAGAVTYDPMANLAATAALTYLLDSMRVARISNICRAGSWLSVGILTKWSVLPLAAIVSVVLLAGLVRERVRLSWGQNQVAAATRPIAIFLVFAAGTMLLIVSKYLKYGSLVPECWEIFPAASCISIDPADGSALITRVDQRLSIWEYFFAWIYFMVRSLYGVRSYISLVPSSALIVLIEALFIIGMIYNLVSWRRLTAEFKVLVTVGLMYGLLLFWLCGYSSYREMGGADAGVNGRYALMVLPSLAVMLTTGMLCMFGRATRTMAAIVLTGFLLWSETPNFLLSEAGRNFIAPRAEGYYRLLGYYPNPVYDQNFNRVE